MTHALSLFTARLNVLSVIAAGLVAALISVLMVVTTPDSVGASPGPVSSGPFVSGPEA